MKTNLANMKFASFHNRLQMSGKHLEDHLRVRINANEDLNKFPATKYAKQWLHEKHMRTDDQTQIRKKQTGSSKNKSFLPQLSFL